MEEMAQVLTLRKHARSLATVVCMRQYVKFSAVRPSVRRSLTRLRQLNQRRSAKETVKLPALGPLRASGLLIIKSIHPANGRACGESNGRPKEKEKKRILPL